jgi:serine acetyltransferase
LGHNARIGAFSSLMPGVHISGNVQLGDRCMIGTGACVLQNCSIGADSKVGAGAVVLSNVPQNSTVVGIPARAVSQA